MGVIAVEAERQIDEFPGLGAGLHQPNLYVCQLASSIPGIQPSIHIWRRKCQRGRYYCSGEQVNRVMIPKINCSKNDEGRVDGEQTEKTRRYHSGAYGGDDRQLGVAA